MVFGRDLIRKQNKAADYEIKMFLKCTITFMQFIQQSAITMGKQFIHNYSKLYKIFYQCAEALRRLQIAFQRSQEASPDLFRHIHSVGHRNPSGTYPIQELLIR